VILCLGATAAQTLLGRGFSVTRRRGDWVDSDLAPHVAVTLHPSATLRIRASAERKEALARYVDDFEELARVLNGSGG
jgi:DNA polymerase